MSDSYSPDIGHMSDSYSPEELLCLEKNIHSKKHAVPYWGQPNAENRSKNDYSTQADGNVTNVHSQEICTGVWRCLKNSIKT